jgi:hypothetical protein
VESSRLHFKKRLGRLNEENPGQGEIDMKLAWPQALTDEEHGKAVEALRTESNTKASTIRLRHNFR